MDAKISLPSFLRMGACHAGVEVSWPLIQQICQSDLAALKMPASLTVTGDETSKHFHVRAQGGHVLQAQTSGTWICVNKDTGTIETMWNGEEDPLPTLINKMWNSPRNFDSIIIAEFPNSVVHQTLLLLLFVVNALMIKDIRGQITWV
jgi:hypothetical protein